MINGGSLFAEFVEELGDVGLLFLLDEFPVLVVVSIAELTKLNHDATPRIPRLFLVESHEVGLLFS